MLILKYFQLPFHFDPILLQSEVNQLEEQSWKHHYQKLHYEGNWTAIPLRSTGGDAENIMVAPTESVPYMDTVFLEETPYTRQVLETFKCELNGVRILKLEAGARIKEHRDAELCFEKGEIRLHIPIVTDEAVEFYLDQERIQLKAGECWYMNFNLPHAVINNSGIDRIHLVIDAKVNDWVKEIFSQESLNKKQIEEPGFDRKTQKQIIQHLRNLNTVTSNKIADDMEAALPSL